MPGTIAIGVRYRNGAYQVTESARLHTRMFVYPDGLGVPLPQWLYMPATIRVDQSAEVVGMYRSWDDGKGLLGFFARPCTPEYPCPDGKISNGWQFFRRFEELPCNITHEVDEGNHAQKVMHYAHHSDRLDDLDPPLWRTSVYLWNYCGSHWDLAWEHHFRMNRQDCSTLGCSFWGPAFEIFGDDPYPPISELGYRESLFIYDGVFSELRPQDGADYMIPEALAPRVPWVTLHLDENRGFGVGNTVNANDPPVITEQLPLSTDEDTSLVLSTESLTIVDPDVDPRFHVAFNLEANPGIDYSLNGLEVIPDPDFFGSLSVPVVASDGAADSDAFLLEIEVLAVNDPPTITGQATLVAFLGVPLEVLLQDLVVSDPDTAMDSLSITVSDGDGYTRAGNIITPLSGFESIVVDVTVSDGSGIDTWGLAINVVTDDTDGDLLGDTQETDIVGTDPFNVDTDRDGIWDGEELEYGLDPLDGSDCPNWICGSSQRGWRLKLQEKRLDTDPAVR